MAFAVEGAQHGLFRLSTDCILSVDRQQLSVLTTLQTEDADPTTDIGGLLQVFQEPFCILCGLGCDRLGAAARG